MITTITLNSTAAKAAGKFSMGQPFKQGDVPAGSTVTADIPNFQCVPKSTWPDGSLMFAVLSGSADVAANVPLTVTLSVGTAAAGTALTIANLKTALGTGEFGLSCEPFGMGRLLAFDMDSPFLPWVSGPQMSSWIYRKAMNGDVHVVAWFEVRLFAGGAIEVLPWVENGYLKVANPTSKNAIYSLSIGQTIRFSERIGRDMAVLTFTPTQFTSTSNLAAPGPTRVAVGTLEGSATQTAYDGNTGIYTYSLTWDAAVPSAPTVIKALGLPNHCRTPLINGSNTSYWLGADVGVVGLHDPAYFQSTDLVPTYGAVADTNIINQQVQAYAPLQQGNFPSGMGSAGYHGSIGLLPEWDMAYVSSGDLKARQAVLMNAFSAGRYGIHFRDETTNRPIRFSQHPTLGLGNGSAVSGVGSNIANNLTAHATGLSPATYGMTHHPEMGFLAYLMTGHFYHLETLQFLATINYLKNSDVSRQDAKGIFLSSAGSNTTRGVAWAWRTLAQAAAITPDNDALHNDLVASMSENVLYNHTLYVAQANNPQGWIQPYSDYSAPARFNISTVAGAPTIVLPSGYVYLTDGYYINWELAVGNETRKITAWDGTTRTATLETPFATTQNVVWSELRNENIFEEATWMQDFVTAAVGYSIGLGIKVTTDVKAKLLAFFMWKAKSIVGRFGGDGADEYPYQYAAVYTIPVAPSNNANWASGTGPWFANWGALFMSNHSSRTVVGGEMRGGNFPEATSYWGNLYPALSMAVKYNVPGAVAARERMLNAPNYNELATQLAMVPTWYVIPAGGAEIIVEEPIVTTKGPSLVMDTVSVHGADSLVMDTNRGLGTLAQDISSVVGPQGVSPLYASLDLPADIDSEIGWNLLSVSSGLTIDLFGRLGELETTGFGDFTWQGLQDGFPKGSATVTVIADTSVTPDVTGIDASPNTATLPAGGTVQINATVSGVGGFSTAVTRTIQAGAGATINSSGLFQGPAPTVQTVFVVRVASTQKPSVYEDITITVQAVVVGSTVTGLDAAPNTANIVSGGTLQITQTLTGTGNFSTAVTREILTGIGGSINTSGLFQAPAVTADRVFTIEVKSVQNTAVKETLTFTVKAAVVVVGTPVYPAADEVISGVQYGPTGADYTGTYVSSGGGGFSLNQIAAAVWSYETALNVPNFLAIK